MTAYDTDVFVIGSGPAGCTAGIYAARAGLSTVLAGGTEKGGQLIRSDRVENFPGFSESVSGFELTDRMCRQAVRLGVNFTDDVITEADFKSYPFICKGKNTYAAKAVIIASGSSVKWLGVPGEEKYIGHGVSSCAVCDGFFYRGKEVAVIGGGNSALEEALYLTKYAAKVRIVCRGGEFTADPVACKRVSENSRINVLYNTEVTAVTGTEKFADGLDIRNNLSGEKAHLAADGIFVSIGYKPETELFAGSLKLDQEGYIITGADGCSASIKGVFAAGDVCCRLRQAVIAAGSGAAAAIHTAEFLRHQFLRQ